MKSAKAPVIITGVAAHTGTAARARQTAAAAVTITIFTGISLRIIIGQNQKNNCQKTEEK